MNIDLCESATFYLFEQIRRQSELMQEVEQDITDITRGRHE